MKNKFSRNHYKIAPALTMCFLFLSSLAAFSQSSNDGSIKISLAEAIRLAKTNNKVVESGRMEQDAADEDLKDAKAAALPSLSFSGSYQRFTKLTLYTNGLSDSKSIPKNPGPNGADLGANANFNIYSGGRNRSAIEEQQHRSTLSEVSLLETSGSIALQVASQYLDLIKLRSQKKLTQEQITRAETRLRNINALYRNSKVTKSDVLRAELNLSNVKLIMQQVDNDISISSRRLAVLINVGGEVEIVPSEALTQEPADIEAVQNLVNTTTADAFGVRKFDENIKIIGARIKGVKSNYYPSISAISAYGLSYPNTIFNPPVDQAYSIGLVGIRVQYNLSSLYHNKHKVSAATTRLKALELQKAALTDNLSQEAVSLGIKYGEALNRINVIQKQIEQAEVNYKIVSAKYFNQLALLTDLLDADNLLQESRFNLILAQNALQTIFCRLQFTSGKL